MYYYNVLGNNLLLIYRYFSAENQNVLVEGDEFVQRRSLKEYYSKVDELFELNYIIYSYE